MKLFTVNDNRIVPFRSKKELERFLEHDTVDIYKGAQKWLRMRFTISTMFYTAWDLIKFFVLMFIFSGVGVFLSPDYIPIIIGQAGIGIFIISMLTFPSPLWFLYAVPLVLGFYFPGQALLLFIAIALFNINTIRKTNKAINSVMGLLYLFDEGEIDENYVISFLKGKSPSKKTLDRPD